MLEFVFFHPLPCDRFTAFARQLGLEPKVSRKENTWEVALPESLDDGHMEQLEQRYDDLIDLNRMLYDQEASEGYHTAGVVVNLSGGETVYAQVEPQLLGRIMEVLTPEEFGRVVEAIVTAVESPDTRTLCQRVREEGRG